MSFHCKRLALAALILILSAPEARGQRPAAPAPSSTAGHYAQVNGLRLYYEIHGSGQPVVLLHGALSNIPNSFGGVIPVLARTHQVIAVEYQAHGHTADIARPLTTEQIADDVSELLRQLRIERADVMGYSMGGLAALQFAARHPDQLRRLVLISAGFGQGAWTPELRQFMASIDPQNAPWADYWKTEFQKYAPRPEQWPAPLVRIKESFATSRDLTVPQVAAVTAPTLIIVGDRDVVPLDHILLLYRTLPHAQLAILPNTDHYPGIPAHGSQVGELAVAFLD